MHPFAIVIAAALAAVAAVGISILRARGAGDGAAPVTPEVIEAELLLEIALRGGLGNDQALEAVRRHTVAACGARGRIDISSWAEQYAKLVAGERRERLLETAVLVAMESGATIALPQYDALVELTFALGYHSDALARLRQRHRFEYVDWAKHGRPRGADRGGGATPLFDGSSRGQDSTVNLATLGLSGEASRQDVVAAYRRLASECHPDRFHESTDAERDAAAERFRAVTRAYEELIAERYAD